MGFTFTLYCRACGRVLHIGALDPWRCDRDPRHSPIHVLKAPF